MLRERLRETLRGQHTRDLLEGLEKLLGELIEEYKPLSVLIAGSLAEGKFVRGLSDIDILAITVEKPGKHERFQLKAIKDVNVEIAVYSVEEVEQAAKTGNQFIAQALEKGVEVYRRGDSARYLDSTKVDFKLLGGHNELRSKLREKRSNAHQR